ncbi:MAG: hypothetical protein QNJ97_06995 [Myxococcota bacterium]|nr:hypothetical protein [Myxococcota bacterium]
MTEIKSHLDKEHDDLSVLLRLEGDVCGHDIDVRVSLEGDDSQVISDAIDAGQSEALLQRYCPFCDKVHGFRFPIDIKQAQRYTGRQIAQHQQTVQLLVENGQLISPEERAYRFWEAARSQVEADPDQAVVALRNAADMFERRGLILPKLQTLTELADLLENVGRASEALKIRSLIPF